MKAILQPVYDAGVEKYLLAHDIDRVTTWANEQGIESASDLLTTALVDGFIAALGLKPVPASKVRVALQAASSSQTAYNVPYPSNQQAIDSSTINLSIGCFIIGGIVYKKVHSEALLPWPLPKSQVASLKR